MARGDTSIFPAAPPAVSATPVPCVAGIPPSRPAEAADGMLPLIETVSGCNSYPLCSFRCLELIRTLPNGMSCGMIECCAAKNPMAEDAYDCDYYTPKARFRKGEWIGVRGEGLLASTDPQKRGTETWQCV